MVPLASASMGAGLAAAVAAAAAASARSRSMSFSIDSRIAYLHARWQISVMSAPEKP